MIQPPERGRIGETAPLDRAAGESIDQFREQVIAKKGGGKGYKGSGNH